MWTIYPRMTAGASNFGTSIPTDRTDSAPQGRRPTDLEGLQATDILFALSQRITVRPDRDLVVRQGSGQNNDT